MPTTEMLHQIVYVSKPTRSMELSEVRELLIKGIRPVSQHLTSISASNSMARVR